MGLKLTDSENQKSTWTPKENSVCLVKCLIALVSKGIKQAWKGLWRPLELRRNICSQCNTKPSWKEFRPSLFIRVRGAHTLPSQILPVTFVPLPMCMWVLDSVWGMVHCHQHNWPSSRSPMGRAQQLTKLWTAELSRWTTSHAYKPSQKAELRGGLKKFIALNLEWPVQQKESWDDVLAFFGFLFSILKGQRQLWALLLFVGGLFWLSSKMWLKKKKPYEKNFLFQCVCTLHLDGGLISAEWSGKQPNILLVQTKAYEMG